VQCQARVRHGAARPPGRVSHRSCDPRRGIYHVDRAHVVCSVLKFSTRTVPCPDLCPLCHTVDTIGEGFRPLRARSEGILPKSRTRPEIIRVCRGGDHENSELHRACGRVTRDISSRVGGHSACPDGWMAALAHVTAAPFRVAIPGHGAPMMRSQLLLYRQAFESFLDCSNSASPTDECGTSWANAVQPLLAPDPVEAQRAMSTAAYYVDMLTANGGRSNYCEKPRSTS
jgi:hypothetical protein